MMDPWFWIRIRDSSVNACLSQYIYRQMDTEVYTGVYAAWLVHIQVFLRLPREDLEATTP